MEACGVDNCRIEIHGGDEVPILDGSANEWVNAIEQVGLCAAEDSRGGSKEKMAPILHNPLYVSRDDAFIIAFPDSNIHITCGINFPQAPSIGHQWFSCFVDGTVYAKEIAPSRTFCIYEEVEIMRKAGLIKGGSAENALVCSASAGWLNPPLRFNDEPCRHKILDLVGDFSLFAQNGSQGLPLAHIVAYKGNLAANHFRDCSIQQFTPNVVVSKGGDGNYRRLIDAVRAIPSSVKGRYVIYVRNGVYDENVSITRSEVTLIGDGKGKTIIRSMLNTVDGGVSILDSGAVIVLANNFVARCISFENASGPNKGQAVALRSDGDQNSFYRCQFLGYQDTLFVNGGRHFVRECDVFGTVDFIFGDAAMVLQKCYIGFRTPVPGKENVVTAQGRSDETKNTGISIHNSNITVAGDFRRGSAKCYLGRPWKTYSRTIVMKSFINGVIDPSGWLDWDGRSRTATYIEYKNSGPGANTVNRVRWPGYRVLQSDGQAKPYTVAVFINGNRWLPSTGVPYDPNL